MTIRCVSCGRFIAWADTRLRNYRFEPASHFGPEICEWMCAECSIEERRKLSEQNMEREFAEQNQEREVE